MREEKLYYVYIATNHPRHTVLYVGITSELIRRQDQHKEKWDRRSFTARYNVNKIVYYETYGDVYAAIAREKQIKGWTRAKKIALINKMNPEWRDLIKEMINKKY